MRIGPRRGEAESAGLERLDRQAAHLGDVVRRRRFAPHRPVAHDVDAQRQVRRLRRNIDGVRPTLQCIHEFGKGLPLPGQACGEDGIGNLLDAFHQVHQRAAMMFLHRGEADTAIAEHDRGDAMPARRREQRIPHRLAVIVRVHVDPAGRDQKPCGVDLPPGGTELAADRGDPVAFDGHITRECRFAGAVDDGAAANNDVMHENRSCVATTR